MEEKRRKSYGAFLNIFYPPRAKANHSQRQEEEENEPEAVLKNPTLASAVPHAVCDVSEGEEEADDEEEPSSSSESASARMDRSLTRSKRKRLRRRKLKQAASSSSRRSIIGPMLPQTQEFPLDFDVVRDESSFTLGPLPEEQSLPETVIRDVNPAAEGVVVGNRDRQGEPSLPQKNKLKQRRLAKKLSRSSKSCTI